MHPTFCLPPLLPRSTFSPSFPLLSRRLPSIPTTPFCCLPSTFSSSTSGEWSGYESQFSLSSTPLPIPDYYIPDEFLEWNQTPLGFEVVHSIHVIPPHLHIKHLRILPSVSVFGDHVDLEDSLHIHDMSLPHNVPFPDGSFCIGPSPVVVSKTSTLQKWPMCKMALRRNGQGVQVQVRFDMKKAALVGQVDMCVEKWSGEWCDGGDLEGGSGFVQGWAGEQCMEASVLKGKWKGEIGEREEKGEKKEGRVYLPKGVDVGVEKKNERVIVSVGWLFEENGRMVMSRSYDAEGQVVNVKQDVEYRVL